MPLKGRCRAAIVLGDSVLVLLENGTVMNVAMDAATGALGKATAVQGLDGIVGISAGRGDRQAAVDRDGSVYIFSKNVPPTPTCRPRRGTTSRSSARSAMC
jgi:7-keto-8-aminopelargonate synthetase-like enzyme